MGPTPVRDMNVWIDDAGDVPEHDGVVRGAGRGDGAFGHVLLGERPAAGWRRADDGVGQPQRPRGPPRPEDQRREPRVLAHDPRDPQVQGRRPHVRVAHIIVSSGRRSCSECTICTAYMNVYVCTVLRRYLEEHDKNPDLDRNETLGHFIQSHGYSRLFQQAYLV